MKTYFTSDTHYNHKNIVKGTTEWEGRLDRCRDFKTLEEHNDKLVSNINSVVKENDTLWHLGDWSFGGFQAIKEFRDRLNCKNIHFVYGNHDHHIENNKDNIQSIFKSVQYYKELSIAGKRLILCHFAMRVWNKSHHGSIMLYGHSHGTLDVMRPEFTSPTWIGDDYFIKNYKTMDVGVDTNNMMPYSLEEILSIMESKDILLNIDHHSKETN